jgi:cullin-associated NEDD8-dissociated protein 1
MRYNIGILAACKDKSASSSSLKIEALTFLRAALGANSPQAFAPHAQQLSAGVFAAASERYYKVAAEALRVCKRLVPVLRADPEAPADAALAPLAQVRARVV